MRILLPIIYLALLAIALCFSGAGHGWGVGLMFLVCFPWSLVGMLDPIPDETTFWIAVLAACPLQWFAIGALLDRRSRARRGRNEHR